MKKHLIPDRSALPRLPYRLLKENWWLQEDFNVETGIASPFKRLDGTSKVPADRRAVRTCN
ncbi:hypothetical protein [Endobacterium cereale]|uniref:hypothetical protein n=1 Tax=Endobacterium cereale TaxID=2663029 RepID=UPI002B48F124|nr:hypothetical protein [Endobacterium cereale]MEB2844423.1 hypothetical protein [Endobacterium cereale]